jgi:succinate dehydrogenase/fumarate reductase-like Fe-S protein
VSSEPRWSPGGSPIATLGEPIIVEVERRIPNESGGVDDELVTYELRPSAQLNILGVFREIYFHADPTFGFRNFECGRGICSTCNVMFEGRVQKGCRILVEPGSRLRIGPQNPSQSIRDVACVTGAEADAEDD